MARSRYEEAIRLYVETAGDEELKALLAQLGEIGDVAEAEGAAARKAFDDLNDAAARLAKVEAFAKIKRDLVATEAELQQAQEGAQALFREFAAGDTSSGAIVRAQRAAREEVARLSAAAEKQRLQVQRTRAELQTMGVDTRSLGSAQAALRGQFAQARAALSGAVGDLQRYRAQSRQTARQVQADNESTAKSYDQVERSTGGLRNALAGVAAFFGFREATQGVVNLLKVAAAAEDARRSLGNLYGSQAEGNRAFAELEQIAKRNGLAFTDTVDAARKLKAFGLDPLNGSLQALIDQNAAVGGSQQDLEGKVLALGQAWAKQKLQGEEILQLVERGVPVWELLQRATGKNVTELQKLSEQGKLGRDVIAALYTEIGKANAGAAEAGLSSLSGLLAQARARWVEFQQAVGNAGLTDYFKRQVTQLLGSTTDLDGIAKRVAQGIIGVVEGVKRFAQELAPIAKAVAGVTGFLATHATALVQVAKAYTALLVVQGVTKILGEFRGAIAASGVAAEAASGKVGTLGRAMRAIPPDVRIAIALVGYEAVLSATAEITNQLTKNSEAVRAAGAAQRALREESYQGAIAFRGIAAANAQYRDTVLQTAEEVAQSTDAERQAYAARLAGMLEYQKAQAKFLIGFKSLGIATREQLVELKGLEEGLKATRAAQEALSTAMEAGAGKARTAAQAYGDAASSSFDQIIAKGETAREAVGKIFDNLDLTKPEQLEKALAAFDRIGGKSKQAAEAVREQLGAELAKLSDEDLPRVQGAAEFVFGKLGRESVGAFAEAVESVNLQRLGVDLEFVRTGVSSVARTAIERFGAARKEIKALGLDSQQSGRALSQAFRGALKDVTNEAEIEELRKKLQEAVTSGLQPEGGYNSALNDLNKKLQALRDEAKGVGNSLDNSSDQGVDALRRLADAAREAGDDVASVGDKAKEAGRDTKEGMDQASAASRSFAVSLDGVSQKFIELARSRAVNFRQLGAEFFAQQKALQDELANLEEQNKAYDEMARRRQELRDKYPLVSESIVDQLLNTEKTLSDNRKRAAEEATRQADEARKAAEEALAATREAEAERARAGLQTVEVIRVEVAAAKEVSRFASDPVASSQIAAEVLRQIDRARTGSNRRNRTR